MNLDHVPQLPDRKTLEQLPRTQLLDMLLAQGNKSYGEVSEAIQGTEWRYATREEVEETWKDDNFSEELGYLSIESGTGRILNTPAGSNKTLQGIWKYSPENINRPCSRYKESVPTVLDWIENPDGTTNTFFNWPVRLKFPSSSGMSLRSL